MRCGEPWEHPVTCPFCSPPQGVIVAKNTVCYARWDRYPVSQGHLPVIPFRYVQDFFVLMRDAIMALAGDGKTVIEET